MLRRDFWLDAAPRLPIARNDDRALHVDPVAREFLVVRRDAVIHVDQGRRDVAIGGVGIVTRQLLGVLRRGRVAGHRPLLEACHKPGRCDEFDDALLRRGKEYVELLDVGVESVRLETCQQPFGVGMVGRRTNVMRPGGKQAHVPANRIGHRHRDELRLPAALRSRRSGREAAQDRRVGGDARRSERRHGGCRRHEGEGEHDGGKDDERSAHGEAHGWQRTGVRVANNVLSAGGAVSTAVPARAIAGSRSPPWPTCGVTNRRT